MCFWAKSRLMRCGGRHPNSLFSFFSLVVSHFPLFFSHHMGDGGISANVSCFFHVHEDASSFVASGRLLIFFSGHNLVG